MSKLGEFFNLTKEEEKHVLSQLKKEVEFLDRIIKGKKKAHAKDYQEYSWVVRIIHLLYSSMKGRKYAEIEPVTRKYKTGNDKETNPWTDFNFMFLYRPILERNLYRFFPQDRFIMKETPSYSYFPSSQRPSLTKESYDELIEILSE